LIISLARYFPMGCEPLKISVSCIFIEKSILFPHGANSNN